MSTLFIGLAIDHLLTKFGKTVISHQKTRFLHYNEAPETTKKRPVKCILKYYKYPKAIPFRHLF